MKNTVKILSLILAAVLMLCTIVMADVSTPTSLDQIKLTIPKDTNVKITVYDTNGTALVSNFDSAGTAVASSTTISSNTNIKVVAEVKVSNYELTSLRVGSVSFISGMYDCVPTDRAEAVVTAGIQYKQPQSVEVNTDSAKPYVIISSYSYGKGDLVAGETRNVTMTFSNTSKYLAVENMMVTITMPADSMVLTSSSNTFYIESLAAGKSITKTVNVTVKPTAAVQSHAMQVNFTYDYLDYNGRKSASTDETISMPVVQVDRFTVTGIEMQDTLYQGEESSLSVNFVNKGRSDVYNISAKVNCEGLANNGEEQYIGNLTSGSTSSADFYITAQQTGALSGEIIITYEDTNMQERTISVPFSGTVSSYEDAYEPTEPGATEDPGMVEPEQPQQSFPWYWIVLGVFIVGGGVFFYLKKRKSNKENVDEDEDF